MRFKDALWDGSDPLYAPGISWSGKNPERRYAHWKCPRKLVKAGYAITKVKIEPAGHIGDEHQRARALMCRELTQEAIRWSETHDQPRVDPDTWMYLIARYRTDEFSPFQEVKANTKVGYLEQMKKLEEVIGHTKIADLTYEVIKTIQKAMTDKGRSVAYIHRFFNTLRRVARYGKALEIEAARKVSEILAEIRFQNSAARQVFPTREQVYRIVAAADLEGMEHYALGIMIQYEFALRAVDVRGQWLETDETEGGVIRNGKRWQDGLTWDMFDAGLTTMTKLISKTRKSLPEPYEFDLTAIPEIQSRLLRIRPDGRMGPVILAQRSGGFPYTSSGWSQAWARLRKQEGLPKELWMMDLRAGAMTEAKSLGANPYELRDAGQHKEMSTTDRYSRGRSQSANNVVRLRNTGK
ncbi:recombinase [Sedimentitalea sp. CY04]|uniref:Recombinase n=1 Tax=Parasedimentitalea denitrificans TaxID=2211118 RepID=A0ABX0WCB5_9RHOB|nr:recombinase [Sedimentitalea sp. CY04]NIZ63326.1 recombinase [Sedimentitalea sp. CY04]